MKKLILLLLSVFIVTMSFSQSDTSIINIQPKLDSVKSDTVKLNTIKSDTIKPICNCVIDTSTQYKIDLNLTKKSVMKVFWHEYKWPIIFLVVAGVVDGGNQAAQFHYDRFESNLRVFHLNQQWWYPNISYTNKYKNHDPSQGESFFASETSLVMFTDWYHFSRTIEEVCFVGASVTAVPSIPIEYSGKKRVYIDNNGVYHVSRPVRLGKMAFGQSGKKWYVYGLEVLGGWVVNRVAFQATYSYLTK